MHIHLGVFAQSCQQTDRQTNNDNYITSLAEVTLLQNSSFICTETVMLHYNILMTEHMDLIS